MIIQIGTDVDESRILWKHKESDEWSGADIDDLILTFEGAQNAKSKTGKWIKIPEFCGDDVSGFIDNHFSCSECKKEAEINPWGFYILSDFCPNCGADMRRTNYERFNQQTGCD